MRGNGFNVGRVGHTPGVFIGGCGAYGISDVCWDGEGWSGIGAGKPMSYKNLGPGGLMGDV